MVSDNGANMKAAWNKDGRWVPCVDHTFELATLPVTYVQKSQEASIPQGSVAEAFAHGHGIVGYLHVSPNAEYDFHAAQAAHGLPQTKVDQDVKTRWHTAHGMAAQLCYNKITILEMDKNPTYKKAGEVWGKNKITMVMWDQLEESAVVLDKAAEVSQSLEGDKYPTSSLVVPMMFALTAASSPNEDVNFRNRAKDEFNDPLRNPVKVPHENLNDKVQTARDQVQLGRPGGCQYILVHRVDARPALQEAHLQERPHAHQPDAEAGQRVAEARV